MMLSIQRNFRHIRRHFQSRTLGHSHRAATSRNAEFERSIRWNDPDLGIDWPLEPGEEPVLSVKDAAAPSLKDADTYE